MGQVPKFDGGNSNRQRAKTRIRSNLKNCYAELLEFQKIVEAQAFVEVS